MLEEGSLWGPLVLQFVLLFVNAIFASAEIAVISMNDNRIAKMMMAISVLLGFQNLQITRHNFFL